MQLRQSCLRKVEKEKFEKEKTEKEKDEEKKNNEKNKIKNKKNKEKAKKSKIDKPYYTQSTFLNNVSTAITGTSDGYVIVWDKCEALCKEDEIITDRRKIKKVQLLKYKKDVISDKDAINFLLNYVN